MHAGTVSAVVQPFQCTVYGVYALTCGNEKYVHVISMYTKLKVIIIGPEFEAHERSVRSPVHLEDFFSVMTQLGNYSTVIKSTRYKLCTGLNVNHSIEL